MLLYLLVLLCVCVEEGVATNEPRFISTGKNITVNEGTILELQCLVSDLGEFLLLWKVNRTKVLFAGNLRIDRDDRISRNDSSNSLTISDFKAEDAGQYSCQINTKTLQDIIYNVQVQTPPIILDEFRIVKIIRFDDLNIDCKTRGGPTQIQWKRGTHLISRSSSLIIERVDRDDTGIYTCTVSNELGQASRDTRVIVLYKPEVEVSRGVINAPIGHTVIAECMVYSEPSPNMIWLKGNNNRVRPSDRVSVDRKETTLTLKIYDVIEADYDTYSCLANNSLGSASNRVVISGRPSVPQFTSPHLSRQQTSYRLEWSLDSGSPITQYVILWKTRDEYKWTNETRVEPQNQEPSFKRSFSFELTSLKANKSYNVEVLAQNRFGETRSDIFTFSTSLSRVCSPSALIALILAFFV